jgi:coproporphyrinogen III oxidase
MINKAITYLIKNNKADNQYHNTIYCMYVFQQSQIICDEYDITPKQKELIGLAAIFHDFNHSGGRLKDSENIQIAIDGFLKFIVDEELFSIPVEDLKYVENIIKATEYPHLDIELTDEVKIIRDFDLIGSVKDGWLNIFFNLAKELNIEPNKFVDIQIKFYDNMKFYTKFANDLKESNIKDIISTLKLIK